MMKAVIIAGGEGTRLRPLTYWRPKPMLPLWGEPMLEQQIKKLRKAGVRDIIINTGYLSSAFERHFAGREGISLSEEKTPLGTAGAVKLAEPLFQDADDIMILNADIVTELDFSALIKFHTEGGNDVTLFSVRVDDPSRFGLILANQDKRVSGFLEKLPLEEAQKHTDQFFINGGVYIMKSHLLAQFSVNKPLSFEKNVFPALIDRKAVIRRFDFSGYWIDVGTKKSYLKAHWDLLLRRFNQNA
jgi:NDP-sugar pyrophosphorylase family protein